MSFRSTTIFVRCYVLSVFFYILVSDKYGEDVIMRIIYLCKLTNRLDQSNHPEYDPHTTTQ